MTAFVATNLVSVYRGESVDDFGDSTDNNTTSVSGMTGLQASITERNQRKFRPTEQRGTLVEEFTIRLRPGVLVYEGDRIIDDNDDTVYQVTDVSNPKTLIGLSDIRVTATRVGNLSRPVNG